MKTFLINYLKNGDLYETYVKANTNDEARNIIAVKYHIHHKFEIGTIYTNEQNYVSSVIEM